MNPMPELILMLKQLRLSGIIDDFGLKPLKGIQDEDFHDVIAERKSTVVTSNLDVPEWPEAFANRILSAATIDRLRHGAFKVLLEGKSYRSPRPVAKLNRKLRIG